MSEPWDSLPAILAEDVSSCWPSVFPDGVPEWLSGSAGMTDADLAEALARSLFLRQTLERHPDYVRQALAARPLTEPTTEAWLSERWACYLEAVDSEPALHAALRRFRREVQFRIIWRDVLNWANLKETMQATSAFADTCIDGALDWLYSKACEEFGVPWGKDPSTREDAPQRMVVLGMGKLGGRELNVSSDIDLIFAFPAKGETRGGRRALDNQQFFIRLGQRLIQALDQITADGFVFRVDMRLRPYGQSGALALSFAALETYYQDQGRDWERYAMVKARVVAGDQRAGSVLMESLRPFVYRKYIDFSAFESLRNMKAMISREVRRKGLENNIKLGSGGIREIEFVVQAFQLIRGGRDRELQQRELLNILKELEELELLPSPVVKELREAYVFLRDLEHALQGMEDKQTQTLPDDALSLARAARVMEFEDWSACEMALTDHRERVAKHFANIIATDDDDQQEGDSGVDDGWFELWLSEMEEPAAIEWLAEQGFEDPDASFKALASLREGRTVQTMQTQGRKRLNQFLPLLLSALTEVSNPSETLDRVLQLVEAILRRTAYMVLLVENPGALTQLVRLCSESPWIARLLAETPLLLDELLNAESLYSPPAKEELQDDLRQQMLRIPYEDLEEQMESLRHFKKAHILRVAASELKGTLPLMKVSDYLTWIAEVVLDHVVDVAFSNLVSRHGYPRRADGSACDTDFAIIGYGKLGGIELGYTSDLDLVFVHQADPQLATDGDKPIDNAVFYTRLGQRIVHILSTQTPSGQLYEVDMRLRPSGNSGLLVSTLQAFEKYQQNDAWTWEHQALARARGVAGCPDTLAGFEKIRHNILCASRDKIKLRQDVAEMREKMRSNLGTPEARRGEVFHIKHDAGGIVDIEFMVQYLMLACSEEHPELTQWSDNIRQLEELGRAGVLEVADTEKLRAAFITLRSTIHRRALQNLNSQVDGDAFPEERDYIQSMWKKVMGG